ncbi:MAG: LuxR C-terminal-related transcriptional regulator [Acidimicrobiales bacterium]
MSPPNASDPVASRRIAVFEQERTTLEVIVRALEHTEGLWCVGSGPDPTGGVFGAEPDVLLVGLHTTDRDAADTVAGARRRFPRARIVVLCTYVDDEVAHAAVASGADAVLPTSVSFDELVAHLRDDAETVDAPPTRSRARDERARARAGELGVTPRQHEVLRNLARGLSPDAVSRRLEISLSTCRDHIKALHRALGCSSTSELIVVSARLGLLPELGRPFR